MGKCNRDQIHQLLNVNPDPQNTAITKTRNFYASCLNQEMPTVSFLKSRIENAGGWHLSGNFNPKITFDERVCCLLTYNKCT